MKFKVFIKLLSISILISVLFGSCCFYTFKGNLSPKIKTVSVATFSNQSSQVIPSLSEDLTEKLKDKFVKEMKLSLVDYDGDINFKGAITNYTIAPASVSGDQTAATTRLSITVKVNFDNRIVPKDSYEASFTNYVDFESSENIADIESELHEEIMEMLVEDIFNKAVNNW